VLAELAPLDKAGVRVPKAAAERPIFTRKSTAILGSFALNLVHLESIPNDLRPKFRP
jgi:hypothetical protein